MEYLQKGEWWYIMTSQELKDLITSLAYDIEFEYNGTHGSICPINHNDIGLAFGDKTVDCGSIEEKWRIDCLMEIYDWSCYRFKYVLVSTISKIICCFFNGQITDINFKWHKKVQQDKEGELFNKFVKDL